jgi:hypothetical protein
MNSTSVPRELYFHLATKANLLNPKQIHTFLDRASVRIEEHKSCPPKRRAPLQINGKPAL